MGTTAVESQSPPGIIARRAFFVERAVSFVFRLQPVGHPDQFCGGVSERLNHFCECGCRIERRLDMDLRSLPEQLGEHPRMPSRQVEAEEHSPGDDAGRALFVDSCTESLADTEFR